MERGRTAYLRRFVTVPTWLPVLITVLVIALLSVPFLETIYWFGDEGLALGAAQRMLRGKVLYRDFFQLVPPLSFLITEVWLEAFGETIIAARMLVVAAMSCIAVFTLLACYSRGSGRWMSAALCIAWAATSYGLGTCLGHHWLSIAALSVGMWATLSEGAEQEGGWIAGLSAGAAVSITTSCGVIGTLAIFASYILSRRRRAFWKVLIASAIFPLAMALYIVATGSTSAGYYDLLVFTSRQYGSIQGVPFGFAADLRTYPLVAYFPAAAVLALLAVVRDPKGCLNDDGFRGAVFFALAGFISCFPRADVYHIMSNVPLALPLITMSLSRTLPGPAARWAVCAAALLFMLPSGRAFWREAHYNLSLPRIHTAAGPIRITHDQGEAGLLRALATRPAAEGTLFYPYSPLLPFVAGKPQTGPIDEFLPHYTTAQQYAASCRAVLSSATWIVLEKTWMDPAALARIFPSSGNYSPPEKLAFERAIYSASQPVARFDDYEVRRRTGSPSLCAASAGS